jgi:hypothetical protein
MSALLVAAIKKTNEAQLGNPYQPAVSSAFLA